MSFSTGVRVTLTEKMEPSGHAQNNAATPGGRISGCALSRGDVLELTRSGAIPGWLPFRPSQMRNVLVCELWRPMQDRKLLIVLMTRTILLVGPVHCLLTL